MNGPCEKPAWVLSGALSGRDRIAAVSDIDQLSSWAQTSVGRVRDHNEDAYLVDESLGLFAVADGMGGHAAGEVASNLALETVQRVIGQGRARLEEFARESRSREARRALLELIEQKLSNNGHDSVAAPRDMIEQHAEMSGAQVVRDPD